jgi:hypothetical protein
VPRGETDVPGLADESNEAVIVGALAAQRGHPTIVRASVAGGSLLR